VFSSAPASAQSSAAGVDGILKATLAVNQVTRLGKAALDETFSYEIEVKGEPEGDKTIPMLYVKIIRDDGTEVSATPLDMRDSGFSVEDEFMFFKAGAYSQNNSSPEPEMDFDKVSFFKLDYSHSPALDAGATAGTSVAAAEPATVAPAEAGVIFSDNFADGGRDDGTDESDTNWWHTTNSSSLEIAKDTLGLVSGGSILRFELVCSTNWDVPN